MPVPRAVREAQMLKTAGQVFAARGYHAASMDEIAEGAGVSKPMVYNYFGSKENLYFAYIDAAGKRLLDLMVRAGQEVGGSPADRLWAGSLAFFTFVDEHRDGYAVLFSELAARGAPFRPEVVRIRRQIVDQTIALLDEVLAAAGVDVDAVGGTEPLAQAFVGAGESLANWWLENPDEPKEAVAGRLMDVGWHGLRTVLSGRGAAAWPSRRPARRRGG